MAKSARGPNKTDTSKLTVSTTPQIKATLERIARTGYVGKTMTEVAERLIGEGIRRLIAEGVIDRR